ncbi:hypothetical protein SR914_23425 [Comamonas testosteroni]|uniref:Uncharacterized protein n=1 Tax=Comamonas testosteroni (strain DSM 14576 / KF-1) TaxID=399795 RepID=B7WXV9_COMTK|nr:hypothetical protein [Comamonas testosteroni]EED67961.1 conserved hypothetical protein [Comamonas testosteroni KF-1]WQG66079.1 hypothetical protein SR914_23425 [Comamonas testosteroni]
MALPLWSFPPNWGTSVKETLEWLTDVLQSPSGAEQRRALRLAPRRSFSFEVLVHKAQRTRSDLWAHVLGAQPFALPIWTDAQYLDHLVAADSSAIVASTAGYDFAAGGLAVLASEDWSISELVSVDQISAGGLTLAAPTLNAWPVGSRLLPARKALLQSLPEPVRMTDELARASVSFELLEPCVWPAELPVTLYRGKQVLESRPDESDDLTLGYERLTQRLDNQVGIPRITDTSGYGFVLQQHAWALWGRDEHTAFRSLLYGLHGRQTAIWVPTHAADLVAAGQVQGQTLQVQPCGYADLVTTGKARMGRQDIRIELATGEALHRRITAAAAGAALETLALDQALPAGVSASAITRISFMALCRMAEDSAEITHHTDADGLAKATLKFRGVRADLEAA